MINVQLENESEWVLKGTITSDLSEINLEDPDFRIEIKDMLEHYISREDIDEIDDAYEKDTMPTLSISNNEIEMVGLPCPACNGTKWVGDTYPVGRTNEQIIKVSKLKQNGDYVDIPQTWTGTDVPALFPKLYNVENTNEYYYYEGNERKQYKIVKKGVNSLPGEVTSTDPFWTELSTDVQITTLYYLKSNPKRLYYYLLIDGVYKLQYQCSYCGGTGEDPEAFTICDGEPHPILTERYYSNIADYNNSDDYSLIQNGFQFWLEDNKLIFRMTARGQSSINPSGYYDELSQSYTERVGFSMAMVALSLDSTHNISFNAYITPKFKISDFFRFGNKEDLQIPSAINDKFKTCPLCSGVGTLVDGLVNCPACNADNYWLDRYGYPYYEGYKQDMLYVNNHNCEYSASYSSYYNGEKNVVSSVTASGTHTPLYGVIASAFIPSYLVTGTTIDVLNPSEPERERNFTLDYDKVKLVNDDDSDYVIFTSGLSSETFSAVPITYFEYRGESISDDVDVTLMQQEIEITDDTKPIIRKKRVAFGASI